MEPRNKSIQALDLVEHDIILALGRQRLKDLCEFEASLCYMANPRPKLKLTIP